MTNPTALDRRTGKFGGCFNLAFFNKTVKIKIRKLFNVITNHASRLV